ncbi:Branchpoint-bridging protein [Astathelohania contejeani]|uniref:Branchpoint-bridging protein n=1 Tax=Astathelohania contejeani TaxID=164912 RepID=A0ABQ7HVR7_9MICR|nr:Branchpoint-bridging protein [Thelohania contejeani]
MKFGPPKQITYPSYISINIESMGIENYMISLRLDNINQKIKNTSNINLLKKYQTIKQYLINEAKKYNPEVREPTEYKIGSRYVEKVYIPVSEYPHINFMGLLLGPRGSTLKNLEQEANIRISIKGKGSFKDESEEPLHCKIGADTIQDLENGVILIENIIESAIDIPEIENKLKVSQLKELALMAGSFKEINEKKKPIRNNYTDWEKYYFWWYFYNSK